MCGVELAAIERFKPSLNTPYVYGRMMDMAMIGRQRKRTAQRRLRRGTQPFSNLSPQDFGSSVQKSYIDCPASTATSSIQPGYLHSSVVVTETPKELRRPTALYDLALRLGDWRFRHVRALRLASRLRASDKLKLIRAVNARLHGAQRTIALQRFKHLDLDFKRGFS